MPATTISARGHSAGRSRGDLSVRSAWSRSAFAAASTPPTCGSAATTMACAWFSIEEFHDKGWRWAAEEVRNVIGGGSAYLSFDIDSLDPVYAPGTGAPEHGGLTTLEDHGL